MKPRRKAQRIKSGEPNYELRTATKGALTMPHPGPSSRRSWLDRNTDMHADEDLPVQPSELEPYLVRPGMAATAALRWHDGVLQQAWASTTGADLYQWVPVPVEMS